MENGHNVSLLATYHIREMRMFYAYITGEPFYFLQPFTHCNCLSLKISERSLKNCEMLPLGSNSTCYGSAFNVREKEKRNAFFFSLMFIV